jgi:hypothetical protein
VPERTRTLPLIPLDDAVVLPRFFDQENTIQIAELRWYPDYPAASGFINNTIFDCTYFCDRRIDRAIWMRWSQRRQSYHHFLLSGRRMQKLRCANRRRRESEAQ